MPPNATKDKHELERNLSKSCMLAVLYGMGARSLAQRIGESEVEAAELLRMHQTTYSRYWEWSEECLDYALLHRKLRTAFGWTIHVETEVNPRFIQNFPMQANGAEMLRLACCFATEQGINICAPIHDAILIEAPLKDLEETTGRAQDAMAKASRLVLEGFELRSEATTYRYPERYWDPRGARMWNTVWSLLEQSQLVRPRTPGGAPAQLCTHAHRQVHQRNTSRAPTHTRAVSYESYGRYS